MAATTPWRAGGDSQGPETAAVAQGEGGDAQAPEPPLQEEVGAGGGGGGQTGDAQGADPSEEEVGEGGEAAGGEGGHTQAQQIRGSVWRYLMRSKKA